jgi:hypothetical protein
MVAASLLVAASGACSNDDDDDSAEEAVPPEFTATTLDRSPGEDAAAENGEEGADETGTTTADGANGASPEQVVEATYEAYWEMREHAIKFPEPDDPTLDDVASGVALDELTATVASLERVGQQGQFGALDSHHVYDVELDGDASATVSDCALSDARVVVAATGEVVRTDPPEGSPFVYTARLLRGDDERWRVDQLSRQPLQAGQVCTNDGPAGQGS